MPSPAFVFLGCLMVGMMEETVAVAVAGEWPFRPSYNEVYPTQPSVSTPPEPEFSASREKNMSQTTDLREFLMRFVQDERICSDPTLRSIILAEDDDDERAKVWWSRRCGGQRGAGGLTLLSTPSESTLIRYRRKSSNPENPQNLLDHPAGYTEKLKNKIQRLIKDKRIRCKPKKTTVPLPNPYSYHTKLVPQCVYIKQCSGCCNSPQLECIPVRTKTKTFPVMATIPTAKGLRLHSNPITMVKVEEHRVCQCECKVRAEHCSPSQEYNGDACQCQCPTHLDRSCPPRKVWNEKECRCECRDTHSCTTGRFFDVNSCRCAEPMYYLK